MQTRSAVAPSIPPCQSFCSFLPILVYLYSHVLLAPSCLLSVLHHVMPILTPRPHP
jgi:hypothetical protein